MRLAAIALLLAACADVEPPQLVPDQRAINAAVEAWDAYSEVTALGDVVTLPYTSRCDETRGSIVIDIRPDVMTVCGEDSAGIVIGCFWPPSGDGSPVIVATDDPWRRTDTVVHEALHWLSWCGLGDGDADHGNGAVWDYVYWDALTRVVL